MPTSVHGPPIAFKRAEPQLFTADLERSLAFFTEKLGFEVRFVYGEPPFCAQVLRGEAHINLRFVPGPLVPPSHKDCLAATMCVEAIDTLLAEFRAQGVEFYQGLRTEPWVPRRSSCPTPMAT